MERMERAQMKQFKGVNKMIIDHEYSYNDSYSSKTALCVDKYFNTNLSVRKDVQTTINDAYFIKAKQLKEADPTLSMKALTIEIATAELFSKYGNTKTDTKKNISMRSIREYVRRCMELYND